MTKEKQRTKPKRQIFHNIWQEPISYVITAQILAVYNFALLQKAFTLINVCNDHF